MSFRIKKNGSGNSRHKKWIVRVVIWFALLMMLLVGAAYSFFWLRFPPNKNGLAVLNTMAGTQLTERSVYVAHWGWTDLQSMFRFSANSNEVQQFAMRAGFTNGGLGNNIPWPPLPKTKPYWWNPVLSTNSLFFQKRPEHWGRKVQVWTLYHELETGRTFVYYWGT